MADFNILKSQSPKFRILAYLKILAFQSPEFKMTAALQDFKLNLIPELNNLENQNPEFKILTDFKIFRAKILISRFWLSSRF